MFYAKNMQHLLELKTKKMRYIASSLLNAQLSHRNYFCFMSVNNLQIRLRNAESAPII